MKLDEALTGVTALGFDTSPFIYFVERYPTYLALVREVVQRVDTGTVAGYSSVITLTEVLTQPKRTGAISLENEYRDLLLHSRNFALIPIGTAIAERAADLRARYNLRTPDALQIAAALSVGCEAFLTNDNGLKRVTELRVLVLDELE
ncbi:MAG: hypothetical protein A3F84_24010 [Candidatus Handelsmanbacteria bacterium RIFCSPLOWO2_12_FULL_64_10]|uniref:PIN domain-containing protein n=1 Tax=Handelsmanbacteria sp. (strain RIFCSPLOWO2_12_FULL_64_10) TaxID=1817868 RepID=A0A1F6CHW0_HANXR|nr:MAG: hypothetical protein A3F84_24010 [Candidatus Handelsmanbacteria bacterium RIFCSPLOWO2_12_FULL_64_10]